MLFSQVALSVACLIAIAHALSQAQTNGASLWGTLQAPTYDQFLSSGPRPDEHPWGKRTANNSNPYKDAPDTGITRHYQFTLSRARKSPDGYLKDVILINDQFPGPLIEANWGDLIEGKSMG